MAFSYRNLGRNGRLGNQLFQIAGTIGKAYKEGDPSQAFFPAWEYAQFFSLPQSHYPDQIPLDAQDSGKEFLQDLALFSDCHDYIRRVFRPSELARDQVLAMFSDLATSEGHKTAVHVRRGDYTGIGYWFPLCPPHYYVAAMEEIAGEDPDTRFLIFSDDPHWCTQQFGDIRNVTVVSQDIENTVEREVAEFALMSSCDAFVISNSTFSWWAAYLSSSHTVITPDRWYNEGLSHLDHRVFTPTSWRQRSIDPIGPYVPSHVSVTESLNGLICTDRRTNSVHHLNSGATLIFELCTGSNPDVRIAEIVRKVLEASGLPDNTIDVPASLHELYQRQIVADANALAG